MTLQMGPSTKRHRGLLWLAIALFVVGGFVGCVVVQYQTQYGESPTDKARTRLLEKERVLRVRPAGFLHLGVGSSVGTEGLFFGSVSDNEAVSTDRITIPSAVAIRQLLQIARAEGWQTFAEKCSGDGSANSFVGTKQIGEFVARLDVEINEPSAELGRENAIASVKVSANHHRFDNGALRPLEPGCITAAIGDSPMPELLDEAPSGVATRLDALDLATGKPLWSVPCRLDYKPILSAIDNRSVTSCDDKIQVRDRDGKTTCAESSRRFQGAAVASTVKVLVTTSYGNTPHRGLDLRCRTLWESRSKRIENLHVLGPYLVSTYSTTSSEGLIRVDPSSGKQLWRVPGFEQEPLLAGNLIVGRVRGRWAGIDPETGKLAWHVDEQLGGIARTANAQLFLAGTFDSFTALNATTGERLFFKSFGEDITTTLGAERIYAKLSNRIIIYDTAGLEVSTVPIPANAEVTVSEAGVSILDGDSLRFFGPSGRVQFTISVASPTRNVVIDSSTQTLIVLDGNGQLTATDLSNGRQRWSSTVRSVSVRPTLSESVVFVPTA